jgi:GxxExxY protein
VKDAKQAKEKLNQNPSSLNEEEIGKIILHSAFKVHTALGPGLLESVDEAVLVIELTKGGLSVERQKAISLKYENHLLDIAFHADLVMNNLVLVELKSVETVTPLFKKSVTNYLKLIPLRLGLLINFNAAHLKHGITRITIGREGKDFFGGRNNISDINLTNSLPSSRSSRDT